jgi:antirestriction protein ArdC
MNIYAMVTERIIKQLEQGIVPWQRPWSGASLANGGAINYCTRKPYSYLNQLLLGRDGEWLTFKQVKDNGGSIKKGAKAGLVVYYTTVTKSKREKENEDGESIVETVSQLHTFPILKHYHVFHISDCTGIESKIKDIEPNEDIKPVDAAENIINGYLDRESGLKFQNDKVSGDAYYSPSQDMVVVPKLSQYEIVEEYYSTTFHELAHSTMHPNRCNRKSDMKSSMFGGEDYSREELVAELGSAMLCNASGLDCDKAFKNSVAYIQGWLSKLKNDNKMIIWASARAEKAAKYIIGIKDEEKQ